MAATSPGMSWRWASMSTFRPSVAHGFGGDGADAGGLEAGAEGELQGEEILDGRGTGEGDEIGALGAEALDAAGDVGGLRHGAVGDGLVHDGAKPGELGGEDVAGLLGADEEDAEVLDGTGRPGMP